MMVRIGVVLLAASGSVLQSQLSLTEIGRAEEQLARAHESAMRLYSTELRGTDVYGRWLDRAAGVAARRSYDLIGELTVRTASQSTAMVVGTGVEATSGRTIRFLHVWASRDGHWQLLAFHETAVAADGSRGPLEVPRPLIDARLSGSQSGLEDEVRRAERERREIFAAHSAERYSQIVTPDYVSILINGVVQGRAERAAMVPSHFVYDLGDMAVMMVPDDVAIVQAAQSSEDGPMRSTRVWVKREGRWMVAAHAGSLVARVKTGPA
jgi:hypothetical protein